MYVVFLVVICFTGVIKYMKDAQPDVRPQIVEIGARSYYLGCARAFLAFGYPRDETMVICGAETEQYEKDLAEAINRVNE